MIGFTLLSLLPDLDVLAFRYGIPYEAPFGHRGAAHSLAAAVVVGLICAALLSWRGHSAFKSLVFCVVVLASHGALDALTDGGLGVALLWPHTDARIFWPWRPIPVAPIGAGMLSWRGAYVLAVEAVLFAPLWVYALWPRRAARRASGGLDEAVFRHRARL